MTPTFTCTLVRIALACTFAAAASAVAAEIALTSPQSVVRATIATDPSGALVYSVQRDGRTIIAPSRIGVTINGADLGAGVELGKPEIGVLDETFPVLGGKRTGRNHARTLSLLLTHGATGRHFTLEARAFDDGFAWRLVVPGTGAQKVSGEASNWQLPARSRVWYAERNNDWKLKSYAGEWTVCDVEELPGISRQGPIQGPPLVAELPGGGYAVITEAALYNYSGMRLRALGNRTLQADFTEGAAGFIVDGAVTTPWRVTLVARDLNGLVNSDAIQALNPAPDPRLFSDTAYIKPGRCVWRWLTHGLGTPEQERRYVDHAAALGFEYSLIDDGWEKWPDPWTRVRELAAHGRERSVGILIWKNSRELRDPANGWAAMRSFLDQARASGAVGVKVDFLNSESKELVDFAVAALQLAAERQLLVNFHGIYKPTGEARRFPNEITREGIRGLELNNMKEGPITARHNAALPFTRFVVGHGDYTPLGYSRPGATTWSHQLATVVLFTSPLQVIGEDPEMLLRDPAARPALDVLKAIPAVWDETRVLAPSAIGEVALMARRCGDDWFVALVNGRDRSVDIPQADLSFLPRGRRYRAVLLSSPTPRSFDRRELQNVGADTVLRLKADVGDGAVLWLRAK